MKLIDELYFAFLDEPKPTDLIGCRNGCCMTQGEVNELLDYDLRSSPPHLIWLYLENAIHTVGNVSNFTYFVPRILELIHHQIAVDDKNVSLDFYICIFGGRLADAGFDKWYATRRGVVDNVFFEIVRKLKELSDLELAADCLCAVSHTNISKSRYFETLNNFERLTGKCFFHSSWKHMRSEGNIKGGFWENVSSASRKEVFTWLMSKEDDFKFRIKA